MIIKKPLDRKLSVFFSYIGFLPLLGKIERLSLEQNGFFNKKREKLSVQYVANFERSS